MVRTIKEVSGIISEIDNSLRTELLVENGTVNPKKLWENTYIKHQIDNRVNQKSFSLTDHVRAMVYSMLSSSVAWERMEPGIDVETGMILPVEDVFNQFDVNYILSCEPNEISEKIIALGYGSQSTRKQMVALIQKNIPKLQELEKEHGSIDVCYQKLIEKDPTKQLLIYKLATPGSELKMTQMGEALIAEYLRNVGYDMAKPDRHIRRILGSEILGCSKEEIVPLYEAMNIIDEIAKELHKCSAEIDFILWSYCAKGYGEICTKRNPKCNLCVAKKNCNAVE